MRDAFGGVWTIQIILVFMIIINSYLAFSVNYTKAFRIKNNIVSIIETEEGFTEEAKARAETVMQNTGYNVSSAYLRSCSKDGYVAVLNKAGGYCIKLNRVSEISGYYSVKTFINIDIPILGKLFEAFPDTFAIKEETKTIYSSNILDLEE